MSSAAKAKSKAKKSLILGEKIRDKGAWGSLNSKNSRKPYEKAHCKAS
jgi:hypothetical protein